jgi:amidase
MSSVPAADPVGALVPHTLQEPLRGATSGPLAGLGFMVKDLFAIHGRKVSNGNPDFYEHSTPARETAPVITRLLEAGATLTGITVCDEFFYSVLGTNAHYGQPVNSAPKHVTGGSSCGPAAAVAASMCDFALGSDTGGSIRVPAAFCGLYGLRPSHGRVDIAGMTRMAPSYDTVGFLARDAELSRKIGHVLLEGAKVEAKVERLIVADNLFNHAEASIGQALWDALDRLEDALPKPEHKDIGDQEEIAAWRNAFRVIQGFEIQSTLLPFIQSHDADLGPGIKERFEMAAAITLAEAEEAKNVRAKVAEYLHAAIPPGTSLMLPTTPTLPPERDIPDGASFSEFRAQTLGLLALPAMPACRKSRCPQPKRAAARLGSPLLAGEAAMKSFSILPSILSRF